MTRMEIPTAQPSALGVAETGIARVAVIGAGAMGSGIAAQFANAGLEVVLLDIPGSEEDPAAPARAGIARQVKARGFMGGAGPGRVIAGNTEDDLGLLAGADWIVEAVLERLDLKADLFRRVDAVRKPGSIVSSNTSTLRRAALVEGQSAAFARDFVITHFFNPPRFMPLVEVVGGPETAPGLVPRVMELAGTVLGKTAVECRDTPGFIANRIGCFWMAAAALEAIRQEVPVELADAVHGVFGIPRTGVFGLFDLVGIDLVPQVWGSLLANLPETDALHGYDVPADPVFQGLLAGGRFGRKTGAGFYRKSPDGTREALDLTTGSYRPQEAAKLPGGADLAALLDDDGAAGRYAWAVFSAVICYAAEHAGEIAATPADVDTAVALGYGWREGPFALARRYGIDRLIARLEAEDLRVPALLRQPAETGSSPAPTLRNRGAILVETEGASLHDLGDGIGCFEIHTKMNSLTPAVMDALEETLGLFGGPVRALVIGNDDPRAFSAGADLGFMLEMLENGRLAEMERYVARGQNLLQTMKHAATPVVAATHGFALGGGCELALHADAIVSHAELTAGLPEANVGLIPAWGGCTQMLLRATASSRGPHGPVADPARVFRTILTARLSGSAEEAREMGILRPDDGIVMHRRALLPAATNRARALLETDRGPADPAFLRVAGASGRQGLLAPVQAEHAAGRVTGAGLALATELAGVLTGGDAPGGSLIGEADMMALELEALLRLCALPEMRERLIHFAKTGKPLRN